MWSYLPTALLLIYRRVMASASSDVPTSSCWLGNKRRAMLVLINIIAIALLKWLGDAPFNPPAWWCGAYYSVMPMVRFGHVPTFRLQVI
jgi:hypothetical protein